MAKKKRKRTTTRPPARPVAATATQEPSQPSSATSRQERKEAARRERERLVRAARRRVLMRRALRWGIVSLVVLGLTAFVGWRFWLDSQLLDRAEAAAEAIGCGEIRSLPSEGRSHLGPGDPIPAYRSQPATSGPHSSVTLPAVVRVYGEPIDETRAVHNLEHAYVIMYYRTGGAAPLPQQVVDALADLARDEPKVILAPHTGLAEGTSLAFAAWTKVQECPVATDPDQTVLAARGFIKRFRGTDNAPEPQGI